MDPERRIRAPRHQQNNQSAARRNNAPRNDAAAAVAANSEDSKTDDFMDAFQGVADLSESLRQRDREIALQVAQEDIEQQRQQDANTLAEQGIVIRQPTGMSQNHGHNSTIEREQYVERLNNNMQNSM